MKLFSFLFFMSGILLSCGKDADKTPPTTPEENVSSPQNGDDKLKTEGDSSDSTNSGLSVLGIWDAVGEPEFSFNYEDAEANLEIPETIKRDVSFQILEDVLLVRLQCTLFNYEKTILAQTETVTPIEIELDQEQKTFELLTQNRTNQNFEYEFNGQAQTYNCNFDHPLVSFSYTLEDEGAVLVTTRPDEPASFPVKFNRRDSVLHIFQ